MEDQSLLTVWLVHIRPSQTPGQERKMNGIRLELGCADGLNFKIPVTANALVSCCVDRAGRLLEEQRQEHVHSCP